METLEGIALVEGASLGLIQAVIRVMPGCPGKGLAWMMLFSRVINFRILLGVFFVRISDPQTYSFLNLVFF